MLLFNFKVFIKVAVAILSSSAIFQENEIKVDTIKSVPETAPSVIFVDQKSSMNHSSKTIHYFELFRDSVSANVVALKKEYDFQETLNF